MNKVLLVGRIASDIRSFTTPSGVNYCRATIAVNRRVSSTEPITDFIPLVAWRNNSDFMARYLSKGALVSIEGSFTTGSYKNASGEVIRTYEVTVDNVSALESKQQREQRSSFANSERKFTDETHKFAGSQSPAQNDFDDNNQNNIKHNFVFESLDDDLN